MVNFSSSLKNEIEISHNFNCLKDYTEKVHDINRNYEKSLDDCYDEDNINRRPPEDLNLEAEISNHLQTSTETCNNMSVCNVATDVNEFFDCHAKTVSCSKLKIKN